MKTDAERGPLGAWLRHRRAELGFRNVRLAAEAITRETGISVSPEWLGTLEAGTQGRVPGPDIRDALERFYGAAPMGTWPQRHTMRGSESPEVLERLERVEAALEGVELSLDRLAEALRAVTSARPARR